MRIGIILHPSDENTPTGLGRFIFELAKEFISRDTKNQYIIYLKRKPRTPLDLPGSNWKVEYGSGGLLWLDEVLRKGEKADVYLFNTPMMPLWYRPKNAVIIALDFAYWHLRPKTIQEALMRIGLFWYHRRSLHRADHVVATSHSTRGELVELFGVSPSSITVIYPGYKSICTLPEEECTVPEKFFFYVGSIKERKNVLNMVKGFTAFKEQTHNDFKFLIAGPGSGPYYESIISYLQEHHRAQDVIFLGYVSDGNIAFLYKHAYALIFTTLIEGAIGMPVLEAMECGLPVITSRTPTAMEVRAGDAALLADPESPQEIGQAMEQIVSDQKLHQELIQKGFLFVKQFEWGALISKYHDVFATLKKSSD